MAVGIQDFESIQYQSSMFHFKEVISQKPHRPQEKILSEARKYFRISEKRLQARNLFPSAYEARTVADSHLELGKRYLQEKKYRRAIRQFEMVIDRGSLESESVKEAQESIDIARKKMVGENAQ